MRLTARGSTYLIFVDGQERSEIRNGQTVDVAVPPGANEVRLAVAKSKDPFALNNMGHLCASRPCAFVADENQTVRFLCGPGKAAFFPFSRFGEDQPDVMLKPEPPRITWRTWRTYE